MKLTAAQCKYLGGLIDNSVEKAPWEPVDTIVTQSQDDGWIFVEQAENRDEGSGVWVDSEGHEHFGPAR